jgi:transketolase
MLNKSKKLNPKIFDKNVEKISTRTGFGEGLVLAGEKDENVVALCADLTESTQMHLFRDKFPTRFFEMGVAEQNMASVASGMSAMGKIPVIGSYAVFSPGRNWEQIRTTICYNNSHVIIEGSHAGVSVGPDGGSHQALEDIALTRVLPRMTVICPCDALEARKAVLASVLAEGPVYIRLSRSKTPVITTEETPFEIGKAQLMFGNESEKAEVGIAATGPLLHKALRVAQNFVQHSVLNKSIKVKVLNLATIKPLDEKAIIDLAKETGAIVTVEEHQIAGGLGSAVAECLAQNFPVPIEFVGVRDEFGQSGTPEELMEHYGMGESHILEAVKKALSRK